ncbi:hypothetical protein EJB05_14469, partial [Eragrostis curvula]
MEQHVPVSFLLLLLLSSLYLPCFCAAANEPFVFSGFGDAGASSNLTLDGVATVTSGGLLELTNNGENIKGHAFFRTPFQFKESSNGTAQSFSATFVFAINSSYTISTDGMAFLISPTTNFSDAGLAQYLSKI